VSDIPFVQALGDALDAATVAPRRRHRRVILAVAALLLVGSGAAAASLLTNSTELASDSVGCYDAAGNVSVVAVEGFSPVATCARVLHTRRPLVACAGEGAVLVYPRPAPRDCKPLPASYRAARVRFLALQRNVRALERSAGCLPPAAMAQRVDALLARTGWAGWRAQVRYDMSKGPCGWVSQPNGAGRLGITGMLDTDGLRVYVVPGPPRQSTARR
jgi:hypothetical protein